jgi:Bifunctional DNA primase/polymerase, N-terminal/Primase C terminal 1 (PriCT-1)
MTTAELQAQVAALNLPSLPSVEIPLPDQPKADTREIPRPDDDGRFKTPTDGAVWMATVHQIPQTPLHGKKPFLPAWQKNASAEPAQIHAWSEAFPGCNFGSVATGKHVVFEADSIAVRERFKSQGHDFTSKLIIESSPGRGHRYYLSAPGVENIGQNKGENFSVRANGEQCVSPGSIHPVTGKQYRIAINDGPLGQPTAEEILFWKGERIEKTKTRHTGLADESPIAEGSRNSALASILGKARQVLRMDKEQLYEYGLSVNRNRCNPPLSDGEVRTIANSIGSYAVKDSGRVLLGGVPGGACPELAWLHDPNDRFFSEMSNFRFDYRSKHWKLKGLRQYLSLRPVPCHWGRQR